MKYDTVIGLEIHAELNTNTKIFCGCKNKFGGETNTHCCPVCIGFPGSLPYVNRVAIEKTILAGLVFNCSINETAVFERKNYFYPDLSKAYQISQLVKPICVGGSVTLKSGKAIRLNRIHLEEDAGKLIHNAKSKKTMVDYNRAGTPLIEMVTDPDFSNADEVIEFLEEVRSRLIFANISNARSELGQMRCDINLSLKPQGSKVLGNRTETKNMNSLDKVRQAILFESDRQAKLLDGGEKIITETRKWNDEKLETVSMRSKEEAQDYRYFPEPDICAIEIKLCEVLAIKNTMPPLARDIYNKLSEFKLTDYECEIILRDASVCRFFLACVELFNEPKTIVNFLLTHVFSKIKNDIEIAPSQLVEILLLVKDKKITYSNAVILFNKAWASDESVAQLAEKHNLIGGLDTNVVTQIIATLIENNSQAVLDYDKNPDKVINYFTGQVMKQTQGKADASAVKAIIIEQITSTRE